MGKCYELGLGVAPDVKRALELYVLAEQNGDPDAFGALARCYKLGIGVEKNAKLARRYAKLAKKSK